MRGRKPREKKLEFQLTGVERIKEGTRDPKSDAKTQKAYIQPKPTFQGGRYVLRTKKFIQLETQKEIKDIIMKVVLIQGERSLQGYLHFDDGTIQQL